MENQKPERVPISESILNEVKALHHQAHVQDEKLEEVKAKIDQDIEEYRKVIAEKYQSEWNLHERKRNLAKDKMWDLLNDKMPKVARSPRNTLNSDDWTVTVNREEESDGVKIAKLLLKKLMGDD